jgi:glycerol uptake operon antiterminator
VYELKGVLPAIRNYKEFDKVLESNHSHIIFLETRISQLSNLVKYARKRNKKVLVHTDLIQGLRADEFGMEYLLHEVKVDGIISTRGNVISIAKKNNILAIQRLFVLDSQALDHNIKIINNVKPDYIEVLPGIVPTVIKEVNDRTGLPIIAGGLIRTNEDIQNAYNGGAVAVTTSRSGLW